MVVIGHRSSKSTFNTNNTNAGCPKKKFLIEIKRSNGENLYTISADGEGFTLWSKNLPHLLLATTNQPHQFEII